MKRLHRPFSAFGILFLALLAPVALSQAAPDPDAVAKDLREQEIQARRPEDKLALVIGVADYQNFRQLKFTTHDAEEFRKHIGREWGFDDQHTVLMTDRAKDKALIPTFVNIATQLRILLNSVKRNSDVVIYYSGHGRHSSRGDWLIPEDANPDALGDTCVALDPYIQELEMKKAVRIVLFLDACRNDPGEPGEKAGDLATGFGQGAQASKRPELAVMYSCEPTEKSWECRPADGQHGVFTQYLLRGLKGEQAAAEQTGPKRGWVTFYSLRQYVRARVEEYTRQYCTPQRPTGFALEDRMVITNAFGRTQEETRLVESNQQAAERLVREAYQLLAEGRLTEAEARANEAREKDRENARAYDVLGSVYQQQPAKLDAAVKAYSEALRLKPDLLTARERLEVVTREIGRQELVRLGREAYAEAVAGDFRAVETKALKVLATEPQNARARFALGAFYASGMRFAEALREYEEALRIDSTLEPALEARRLALLRLEERTITSLLKESQQAIAENRFDDAESRALQVVARQPNNAPAHYVLGRVYAQRTRFDDALREFGEALKLDPALQDAATARVEVAKAKEAEALTRLAAAAVAALQADRFPDAEAAAEKVLQSRPDNSQARYVLGRVYEKRGAQEPAQLDLALQKYQEALNLEPGLQGAREGRDRVLKAVGLRDVQRLLITARQALQERRFDAAERSAQEVLSRSAAPGDRAQAYLTLGMTAAGRGQHPEALRAFREAQQLDAGLAGLAPAIDASRRTVGLQEARDLASRASVYLADGRNLDAANAARAALERDRENSAAYAVLGNALLRLDDVPAGREAIRTAKQQDDRLALVYVGLGTEKVREAERVQDVALVRLSEQKRLHEARLEATKEKKKERVAALSEEISRIGAEIQPLFRQARGLFGDAEAEFKRAVEREPQSVVAHLSLGYAFANQNYSAEYLANSIAFDQNKPNEEQKTDVGLANAVREFETVRTIDPRQADAYLNIGQISLRRGIIAKVRNRKNEQELQLKEAEEAFGKVIQLKPDQAGGYAYLAAVFFERGKKGLAREQAAEAAKRGLPEHHWIFNLVRTGA